VVMPWSSENEAISYPSTVMLNRAAAIGVMSVPSLSRTRN
jgi:hypothetical protein